MEAKVIKVFERQLGPHLDSIGEVVKDLLGLEGGVCGGLPFKICAFSPKDFFSFLPSDPVTVKSLSVAAECSLLSVPLM